MKTLLATHIARFDLAYSPQASTRILRYLRNRAKDFKVDFPSFAKPKGKGKVKGKSSSSAQIKRIYGGTQRSWNTSDSTQAKAPKAGSLRPRALRSYSYRRRLKAPPLHSQLMLQTSLATSVTRKVITSPNALNGCASVILNVPANKAASSTPGHDF